MDISIPSSGPMRRTWIALAVSAAVSAAASPLAAGPASAAPCEFEPQGEGRVTAVLDARSFRLQDGREVRLAGIEAPASEKSVQQSQALGAMLIGRDVRLGATDDTPDRYGRQTAFAFLATSEIPVQAELLMQGEAVASASVADKECAAALMAAEAAGRDAKRGIWADPTVIKNTESPGDILTGIGRFTLAEGKVLSVRQAGATTYLNFGRNWTRDFAVTIPRRALAGFAAAGLVPKSLESKRIRIRGFVEARRGPRIEALRVGQIEVLGGN
jgi:endonuclease YncB( thermonuclease family)